jgi:hypothetical protein
MHSYTAPGNDGALLKPVFIGLLDIFGFESLKNNSFEQLCINYCNETLQQKFCQDVFKTVAKTYEEEGIKLPVVEFTDNAAVLKAIEGKMGIFDLLNEECVRPGGNNKSFTSKAITSLAKSGDSCLQVQHTLHTLHTLCSYTTHCLQASCISIFIHHTLYSLYSLPTGELHIQSQEQEIHVAVQAPRRETGEP